MKLKPITYKKVDVSSSVHEVYVGKTLVAYISKRWSSTTASKPTWHGDCLLWRGYPNFRAFKEARSIRNAKKRIESVIRGYVKDTQETIDNLTEDFK